MIQALIGKKLDQTQKFLESGRRVPVTEIEVSDNVVLQAKNLQKDGYNAVQLGYGIKKNGTKALVGHVKKAGLEKAPLLIKEIALKNVDPEDLPKPGDLFNVSSVFTPGDVIDVTGTSKGNGFAGVVKKHGFRGGPKTHGQSDRHRAPGSIGQTTTPGRVYRGKKMAGRMGMDTVTVANLTVVDVDEAAKKLYVLGLVPGHKNSMLLITQKGTDKKFVPLLKLQEEVASEVEEAEIEAASNATVEEQQEPEISGEVKEAVEESAVQAPVESVEEKVEEEVAELEEAASVQEDSGEPKKEEENAK